MSLGESITKIRKGNKLTLVEFAERTGVSKSMLNYYEQDKNSPKAEFFISVYKEFGVSPNEVFQINKVNIGSGETIDVDKMKADYIEIINKLEDTITVYNDTVKNQKKEIAALKQEVSTLKEKLKSIK